MFFVCPIEKKQQICILLMSRNNVTGFYLFHYSEDNQ